MSFATLSIRIAGDARELTKSLDKVERDVMKATQKISKMGDDLTKKLTLPVLAASAAFAKLAADDAEAGRRLERVFGGAVDGVNAKLQRLMQTVPETMGNLQALTVSAVTVAEGLNLPREAAQQMSTAMVQLAGDMAAFKGGSMEDALGAIEKGLNGSGKALLEYGIKLDDSEIKQRAMAMGILKSGQELTNAGTAAVAWNLILEKSSQVQGEAARTAGEASKSWKFLLRDAEEFGGQLGQVVLPAMHHLIASGRQMIAWLTEMPPWLTKTVFGLATVAAAAGPILKLIAVMLELRTAMVLIGTVGIPAMLGPLGGLLTTLAKALGLIALVTVGVAAWRTSSGKSPLDEPGRGGPGSAGDAAGFAMREQQRRMDAWMKQWLNTPGFFARDVKGSGKTAGVELLGNIGMSEGAYRNVFNRIGAGFNGQIQAGAATGTESYNLPGQQTPMALAALAAAATNVADAFAYTQFTVEEQWDELKLGLQNFGEGLRDTAMLMKGAFLGAIEGAAYGLTNLISALAQRIGGGGVLAGLLGSVGAGAGGAVAGIISGGIGGKAGTVLGAALGPLGGAIGGLAGAAIGSGISHLFGRHKKASDGAADSMNRLAATTERLNSALNNVPQGFKVGLSRFYSTIPEEHDIPNTGNKPPTGGGRGGAPAYSINIQNVTVTGVEDVDSFYERLARIALRESRRGGVGRFALAGGSA